MLGKVHSWFHDILSQLSAAPGWIPEMEGIKTFLMTRLLNILDKNLSVYKLVNKQEISSVKYLYISVISVVNS